MDKPNFKQMEVFAKTESVGKTGLGICCDS